MKKMRVYVAGATSNVERAARFIERVRANSRMTITHDWTADVFASRAAGVAGDHELSNAERERFASVDLVAVESCDALVVLAEEDPAGRGMWVELGYAYAFAVWQSLVNSRTPIRIFVSGGARRSIFTVPGIVDHEYLEGTTEETDAQAFLALRDLLRWRVT